MQWDIKFKTGTSVIVTGKSLHHAIVTSGLIPFLVIDVESITQIK
jgi:hypothetical protein